MRTAKHDSGFKWAVIGPGQIARDFMYDIALVEGFHPEVCAVLSPDGAEARAFADRYHIPGAYTDVGRMLAETSPDMVYIATPHSFHCIYTLQCLEAGAGVLCEKPLGINGRQVEEMVRASRTGRTFLMEGMWIRYLPSIHRLMALLAAGTIGAIRSLEANMSFRAPRDSENRFYDPGLGGGSLLDLGIYPVYLALLLMGEPDSVQAHALLGETGVDEGCVVILGYGKKNAYALVESSLIKETNKTAIIWGEKGSITVEAPWNEKPPGIRVQLYEGQPDFYPLQWPGRGFQYEIGEALRCVLQGRIESPLHDHARSLALARLLDEIRRQTAIYYPGGTEC